MWPWLPERPLDTGRSNQMFVLSPTRRASCTLGSRVSRGPNKPSSMPAEAVPTGPPVQVVDGPSATQGLFATVQVAQLPNGRLAIPPNMTLAIEIGTSDRDTLDTELLPRNHKWFLLSLEPLSDKYARGLARNAVGRGDQFQGLGQHHKRGLILPLAVGDVPTEGGSTLTFNVGQNAGCSSLLPINRASNRLKWCKQVAETRRVPTVSLEAVLGWAASLVDSVHVQLLADVMLV